MPQTARKLTAGQPDCQDIRRWATAVLARLEQAATDAAAAASSRPDLCRQLSLATSATRALTARLDGHAFVDVLEFEAAAWDTETAGPDRHLAVIHHLQAPPAAQ